MPNPVISQLNIGGTVHDIKDAAARQAIADLQGFTKYLGVTTTALTDGATTNPITVNGESVTAEAGAIVLYGNQEFIFDGTHWNLFGDLSALGDLAYKNSASGSITPAGSVSGTGVTLNTTTVKPIATVGTLPSCTMPSFSVSGEVLTITDGSYTAGTLPTAGSDVTVATSVKTITDPSFTGTAATVTVS